MDGYLKIGYGSSTYLAPDNWFGRLGAHLYNHTDDGFGVLMLGLVFLGGGIPWFAASLASGYLISAFFAFLFLGVYFVLAGSTIYSRVRCQYNRNAMEISYVFERYASMDKNERQITGSLVKGIKRNIGLDEAEVTKRVTKFNYIAGLLDEGRKKVLKDDSDLNAADAFIEQYLELTGRNPHTGGKRY